MAKRRKETKRAKDETSVSVWFWMFAQVICLIPLIGWVMTIVWAFAGQNQSRKNYFRAVLVWWGIVLAAFLAGVLFGIWPTILRAIEQLMKSIAH